jgi:hypothetical protein
MIWGSVQEEKGTTLRSAGCGGDVGCFRGFNPFFGPKYQTDHQPANQLTSQPLNWTQFLNRPGPARTTKRCHIRLPFIFRTQSQNKTKTGLPKNLYSEMTKLTFAGSSTQHINPIQIYDPFS